MMPDISYLNFIQICMITCKGPKHLKMGYNANVHCEHPTSPCVSTLMMSSGDVDDMVKNKCVCIFTSNGGAKAQSAGHCGFRGWGLLGSEDLVQDFLALMIRLEVFVHCSRGTRAPSKQSL